MMQIPASGGGIANWNLPLSLLYRLVTKLAAATDPEPIETKVCPRYTLTHDAPSASTSIRSSSSSSSSIFHNSDVGLAQGVSQSAESVLPTGSVATGTVTATD